MNLEMRELIERTERIERGWGKGILELQRT
jgi:hypothetical protein